MESATPDGHTAPWTHGTQAKPAVATHSERTWSGNGEQTAIPVRPWAAPRAEGFRAVTRPREPRAR